MPYTNTWNDTTPLGSEPANTIDDIFRSLKVDIEQRFVDIFAMPNFTADPLRPYGLKFTDAQDSTIFLGDNAGTPRSLFVKDKTGVTTFLTINNVGITSNVNFNLPAAGLITWTGRSVIRSPSDGVIQLTNNAGTDFGRLTFGPPTAAFPALLRSSTTIVAVLADNSAHAPFTTSFLTVSSISGINTVGPVTSSSQAGFVQSLATNSHIYNQQVNNGNNILYGIESSIGGQLFTGTSAFSAVFGSSIASRSLHLVTNNSVRLTIDPLGNVLISVGFLQFGGTSAAFSAILGSGTTLLARLADNSGPANFDCNNINANVITANTLTATTLNFTNVTVSGTLTASAAQTQGAQSGSIINGGTLDISVPSGVSFFSLQPVHATLSVNTSMWIIRRDISGVNNTNVTNLSGGASTPVTSLSVSTIRVTNNLGSTVSFQYGFLRLALPI